MLEIQEHRADRRLYTKEKCDRACFFLIVHPHVQSKTSSRKRVKLSARSLRQQFIPVQTMTEQTRVHMGEVLSKSRKKNRATDSTSQIGFEVGGHPKHLMLKVPREPRVEDCLAVNKKKRRQRKRAEEREPTWFEHRSTTLRLQSSWCAAFLTDVLKVMFLLCISQTVGAGDTSLR